MADTQKKLPDSVAYIPLIIEALRSLKGVAKAASVKEWIAEGLASQNKPVPETILASGAPKFANDIQWARMFLVNAGMLEPMESAGYGIWKLTPSGWETALDPASIKAIFSATAQLKGKPQSTDAQEAPPEDYRQPQLTGMESWEFTLKKTLTSMPDKGFERLCAYIMTRNGLQATKVTGQTADGGVDGEGMLAFDDLCLIKTPVAWQCKRFMEKSVSSDKVRDFRGAIEGRAKYGLIFTTSTFTTHADLEARRPGATPIELVGLDRLIELMGKHEIGVKDGEVSTSFFTQYMNPAVEPAGKFQLA